MYIFKEDVIDIFNKSEIARQVGVAIATITRIFNRKQKCSKRIAYYIVKTINENAEIEDYFERVS